jgi:hypothetical protein
MNRSYMYTHTYIHTYIHTCIHTCIHTYIHTYIHTRRYRIAIYQKSLVIYIYINPKP